MCRNLSYIKEQERQYSGSNIQSNFNWLKHLWDYENLFKTREVRAIEGLFRARSGGIIGISFRFFSNEGILYALDTTYHIKKKIILNLQLWDLFQWTKVRVRNSCGKRAISVQTTEVLLYIESYIPHSKTKANEAQTHKLINVNERHAQ